MSQVLGRVTTGVLEIPRGPDVVHRVAVDKTLFEVGAEIVVTLPRNLTCATCEGGGCDGCDRAGALTLRRRGDAPETLRVTLPLRTSAELEREPMMVLRVPDQGGYPTPDSELPRGLLFLKVEASETSDAGIESASPLKKKKSKRPSFGSRNVEAGGDQPESRTLRHAVLWDFLSVVLVVSWIVLLLAYSASLPR